MKTDCQCGCCQTGIAPTPVSIVNSPGQTALHYRIGTQGRFLAAMRARLASQDYPALAGLTTRAPSDASLALLDGWACVADVLTFYQERLANEGYLRTATERRSVLELARLLGYAPRPGVAASVHLAFTIDENFDGPAQIPAGTRVQSVPGPGEMPQSFETAESLVGRREWNTLKPRLSRPQTRASILFGDTTVPGPRLYLQGTSTNLKINEPLLVQFGTQPPQLARVTSVTEETAAQQTLVHLEPWLPQQAEPFRLYAQQQSLLTQFGGLADISAGAGPVVLGMIQLAQGMLLGATPFIFGSNDSAAPQPGGSTPRLMAFAATSTTDWPLVARVFQRLQMWVEQLRAPASDAQRGTQAAAEAKWFTALAAESRSKAVLDQIAQQLADLATQPGTLSLAERQEAVLGGQTGRLVKGLDIAPSLPPKSAAALPRSSTQLYQSNSDLGTQALSQWQPTLAANLSRGLAHTELTAPTPVRVFALRTKAALFGNNAPEQVTGVDDKGVATRAEWTNKTVRSTEDTTALYLDAPSDKVLPGSWVVLDFSAALAQQPTVSTIEPEAVLVGQAGAVFPKLSRAAYNLTGPTTRVGLLQPDGLSALTWLNLSQAADNGTEGMSVLRATAVYAQSEELQLAEEPIRDDVCGGNDWIELDRLVAGLKSGRWLIVAGERADLPGTTGVQVAELVMLADVRQYVRMTSIQSASPTAGQPDGGGTATAGSSPGPATKTESVFLPGDTLHTFIQLATPLSYCYRRATVTLYGNIAPATNGQTCQETLGSGDATQALQSFSLHQSPLTYVPADNPTGVANTLALTVNDIQWHEAPAFVALGPTDRRFITRTDNDDKITVVFGDGKLGARLPTGTANVSATYRFGIGQAGNVSAGQISQLAARPLGLKGVTNPIRASGGADRETRDQARENAPLAVMALDRLVSVQDYADFARTFAGIGKAVAVRLSDGERENVFITIAGANDIPIDATSDLYLNLVRALRDYGDPAQPFTVSIRELLMLAVSARCRLQPDYLWDPVSAAIRAALLDRFSFANRALGQPVFLSEVIATIQSVAGVEYVDVDLLGGVAERNADGSLRSPGEIAQSLAQLAQTAAQPGGLAQYVEVASTRHDRLKPAQIAFFLADLPDTILLNPI